MDTVSVLIKPASGRCNLRCKYCFYEDVSGLRSEQDLGLMTEETLEELVRQAMELADRRVSFAFQGGEPMLRGLAFYEKFMELEKKYGKPGVLAEHSIQTNGTLIDEAWADFFRENRFLVGISLDGTRSLHDMNRVDVKERARGPRWSGRCACWRKSRWSTTSCASSPGPPPGGGRPFIRA